jgi:hypothetical protein
MGTGFLSRGKAVDPCYWPYTTSFAEVKATVELYFCSPSGRLWQVIRRSLAFCKDVEMQLCVTKSSSFRENFRMSDIVLDFNVSLEDWNKKRSPPYRPILFHCCSTNTNFVLSPFGLPPALSLGRANRSCVYRGVRPPDTCETGIRHVSSEQ